MSKTSSSENRSYIVKTFPVGPIQCNCSIIGDPVTKKALVVDPGGDADKIIALLKELDLKVVAIIHTHAHLDHILAAGEIKKATGAPIYLHEEDRFLWDMLDQQCAMFGIPYSPIPDPDHYLADDQDLGCCGGVAIHTPGHTPGSTSFWFEESKTLIAGDTLFKGSIGRTDLWGGDFDTIAKSIKERIYSLDEEAEVITGHGPSTTIGDEKVGNMFVKG
ncbi:MAG: MBL fold metallo-hydrolase [Porticoccaceae bacterium]|nr:MBL fold metallo-hydrolase [Pseudomonadales bacterium]MCP5171587.1 MBL fold metallo-hydrolase [Pseudomonadales bacterium]